MPSLYTCPRCGYVTDRKCNMRSHIQRKTTCEPLVDDIDLSSIEDEIFHSKEKHLQCRCGKGFASRSGFYKHACDYGQEIHYDDLTTKIKEMEKEIDKLKSNASSSTSYNIQTLNNNNNNTINNIVIQLTDFGKENMSHLSTDFFRECLMNGALGVLQVIEKVWFDHEHPENFNIRLASLKNMLVQYYKHPGWEICGFHDAIDKMIGISQNKIVVESNVKDLECTNSLVTSLDGVQNLKPEVKRKIKDKCKGKLAHRRSQILLQQEELHTNNILPLNFEISSSAT